MDEQGGLFERAAYQPLAERIRPRTLEEFVGQEHLLGKGKVLRRLIENDHITSMIFWGPPGVGKTTLAQIIAARTQAKFINFSAVTSGIKDIRTVMQEADRRRIYGERIIVFVDEIHRFNKAQQDAFLPFVEKGSIVLIGAKRGGGAGRACGAARPRGARLALQGLNTEDIKHLLQHAISSERGLGRQRIHLSEDGLTAVAAFANGDARSALSTLEMLVLNADERDGEIYVTEENLAQCISRKSLLYDKSGEEHYNLISALHKSMRNSDPDAAVYWLARMLEAGEDPLYVARRVTRFAAEDVGLADTRALEIAVAAYQACHYIGFPECNVHLTEAVVYLSLAPKSNAMETAYLAAAADARTMLAEPVPLVIRNAPTRLMKDLDYGKDYQYAHDTEEHITNMQCLPDSLVGRTYYHPTEQGMEARFRERLDWIKEWKKNHPSKINK